MVSNEITAGRLGQLKLKGPQLKRHIGGHPRHSTHQRDNLGRIVRLLDERTFNAWGRGYMNGPITAKIFIVDLRGRECTPTPSTGSIAKTYLARPLGLFDSNFLEPPQVAKRWGV